MIAAFQPQLHFRNTFLGRSQRQMTVSKTLLCNTWTWKSFDIYRVSFLVENQICFLNFIQAWSCIHDLTLRMSELNWTWTCTSVVGFSNRSFSLSFPLVIISLYCFLSQARVLFLSGAVEMLIISLLPSRSCNLSYHRTRKAINGTRARSCLAAPRHKTSRSSIVRRQGFWRVSRWQ